MTEIDTHPSQLATIEAYYNGCTVGDLNLLHATLHQDVVHYVLSPNLGSKPVAGREHLARYWRKVTRAINARWVVDQAISMGNQTVIEWSMLWEPRPGDERIVTRGAEWFVFRAGLIFEIRSYYRQRDARAEPHAFPYAERGYSTSRSEIWENFSPQHGRTGSAAQVYAERLGANLFAHISALDKAMNCSLYGANVSHLSPQAWETVPVHPIDTTDRQVGSPILSGQEYLEIFGPC
jgi:hypothetical protein